MTILQKFLFLLLASMLINISVYSQNSLQRSADGRYVSGISGLMDLLRNNVKFPDESASNNSMGYSVSSIEITPGGEIENIKIINPVDPFIDAEMVKILAGTKGKWMNDRSTDENLFVIVQICFIPFPVETISLCESPVDFPAFLSPITIINKVIAERYPLSEEELADIYNRTKAAGDLDSAVVAINEMIRRNPFTPELYQIRISLNNKLGKRELVVSDLNRISDFAGGISLQKLITKFYDRNGLEVSEEEAVFREAATDLDNGLKSVARFNYRGDTLEIVTCVSVDPEIREGITREFKNGILKRKVEYSNNQVSGYITEYNPEGDPKSISLVLNDTIRALLFSETDEGATYSNSQFFSSVEKTPSFKKGDLSSFRDWVQKRLRYPAEAEKRGLQGKVYLSFIVDTDGSLSNVTVLYGSHPLLDDEALRVVNSSPKWTPGYSSGNPVLAALTIMVGFQLK